MFDGSLPGPAELQSVDDAVLVGAITDWSRAASAAEARGFAAMAELARRRCAEEEEQRSYWLADPWDCAGAEVAAALNVGLGKARERLEASVLLRDRLPKTNALFLAGAITAQMVTTISWRTYNVTDEAAWALIDAALVDSHHDWGPLPHAALSDAVDYWVALFDPVAVRRTRSRARDRTITIGDREDHDGTTSIWGRLLGPDAALLKKQLAALADGVCKDDPRTRAQRMADALGALAAHAGFLACRCENPDCPAAGDDGRGSAVSIYIVAPAEALHAVPDPMIHGQDRPEPTPPVAAEPEPPAEEEPPVAAEPEPPAEEEPPAEPESPPFIAETRQPAASGTEPSVAPQECDPARRTATPAPVRRAGIGVILGGGIVPAPLLAELIRNGAKVRIGQPPCSAAEPQYRPSTALAAFVRARDMTCRAPGCTKPADLSDIDHTIAWPKGPTHASNNSCKCRKHHLLKTFWTGPGGWSDHQRPDGSVVWTTPAGLTYTTRPGATLFFPHWNIDTPPPTTVPPPKGVKPPGNDVESLRRKRTRAQDRERRIQAERERNAAWLAQHPPEF